MWKLILLICVVVFPVSVLGDTPLNAPKAYKTCDFAINFCAYLKPGQDTKVYSLGEDFKARYEYSIEGWHRSVFISPNGKYFAVGYSGLNLLPLDVDLEFIILTVFKHGKKYREVKLGEIIKSLDELKRTSSHYEWGKYLGFYSDSRFFFQTNNDSPRIDFDK